MKDDSVGRGDAAIGPDEFVCFSPFTVLHCDCDPARSALRRPGLRPLQCQRIGVGDLDQFRRRTTGVQRPETRAEKFELGLTDVEREYVDRRIAVSSVSKR
jgi:hypothetical protein